MSYILLHGLGQTSSSWNETIQSLNEDWDILCPNLSDWIVGKQSCYDTLYKAFEKYCEQSNKIKFWYKNGESTNEFFSIIYLDKLNKAWTFYPDYIVGDKKGDVWIIETKGGEDAYGNSKNIDIKIENKYESLKSYADKYNLKWGFIRDIENEIFISFADEYKDDMKNKNWINVKEVL